MFLAFSAIPVEISRRENHATLNWVRQLSPILRKYDANKLVFLSKAEHTTFWCNVVISYYKRS